MGALRLGEGRDGEYSGFCSPSPRTSGTSCFQSLCLLLSTMGKVSRENAHAAARNVDKDLSWRSCRRQRSSLALAAPPPSETPPSPPPVTPAFSTFSPSATEGSMNSRPAPSAAAAEGPEDHVAELMGRLQLTAMESAPVVLEDETDEIPIHSEWAIVGKVLAPSIYHINTIRAALRPAWGNPRGLVINSAGDNKFVAEFGSKADKDWVMNGPPWVIGKHAVLLQNFNADLKPQDMKFNRLAIWIRILNLPFGYMQEKWGKLIAGMVGCEGFVPKVDCDDLGRCWGSFMRARIEVETDKPLMRGVTVYSQRRKVSEWFQVQYEQLPHYCFSCGILGHSSIECKNPGGRDEEGRLPYSADRLCAPVERKKKSVNSKSSNGSVPANPRRSSARSPD